MANNPDFPLQERTLTRERVRVLDLGEKSLVMDRISGKWVFVENDETFLLPLVFSGATQALPDAARLRIEALRDSLERAGIGRKQVVTRDFNELNTLIVKLTNACNLACTYCYDHETVENSTVLSVKNAIASIDQALDLSTNGLWVILHGGEPTLLWKNVELLVVEGRKLAASKSKVIEFAGQTNLTRLSQRMVDFSAEHQISWGISFDGPAAMNDIFRIRHDGGGSHNAFEKSYREFPEFVRACAVMSTVTSANDGALLEVCRYFHSLGMGAWDWSLFQPTGRARSQAADLEPNHEKVISSWTELFDSVAAGEFDGFLVSPVTKYLENFVNGPGRNMCMRPKCGAARDLLSISADGTIEACDCIDPQGPLANLGKIGEVTLSQARNSPVANRIRSRDLSDKTPCGDCIWYGVCGGTCMALSRDVDLVSPLSCKLALVAFGKISASLAKSDSLLRYMRSIGH